MDSKKDRVVGRLLAVEELSEVAGAKTFPTGETNMLADSGTSADSGTIADSGTTSDSGTAADTSPNPLARDAPQEW